LTKPNPYVRSWDVPTSSDGTWKVSERVDGTFACSCPKWKFARAPKRECHHIAAVRAHPNLYFAGAVARATGKAAPCPRLSASEQARDATAAPERERQDERQDEADRLETALREAKGQRQSLVIESLAIQ
jgi:hypothetical protein